MAHLVFLPAFVFDVLCFTFYFAAFTYYLSFRTRGLPLTPMRIVVFLLLYVGALDSKEMAVTLPVMVLLYELIWGLAGFGESGEKSGGRPYYRRQAPDFLSLARSVPGFFSASSAG